MRNAWAADGVLVHATLMAIYNENPSAVHDLNVKIAEYTKRLLTDVRHSISICDRCVAVL